MSLIKQIEEMRNSGKSDSDIITGLMAQGNSPKDVEDALSQSQVKAAVSQEYSPMPGIEPSMQQSILSAPQSQSFQQSQPVQEIQPPRPISTQQSSAPLQQEPLYEQQPYYEGYEQAAYPSYSYSAAPSSETISEVVEQILEQKLSKIKNELSRVDDFKSELDGKMDLLKERLRRIEGIIDNLQDSIIRKIGEYGENIQSLGKDLQATQDSFSKVIHPLVSRQRQRTQIKRAKTSSSKASKARASKKR